MSHSVGLLTPLLYAAPRQELSADEAVLAAALRAELSLSRALVKQGLASAKDLAVIESAAELRWFSVTELAAQAVRGGNFIIPLVEQLKSRVEAQLPGASWLVHPGATSQDILDSALILVSKSVSTEVISHISATQRSLISLAELHRERLCAARTLTQPSVPYTWGLRFSQWLQTLTLAKNQLQKWSDDAPMQWGGASGTNAALNARFGSDSASLIVQDAAADLELCLPELPWHSNRSPMVSLATALAAVNTALGTIANNIVLLSRPEFGELAEGLGEGHGGSSAMPQKRNPIQSIMLRSAISPVPALTAEIIRLSMTVDERSDGAWQAEWPILQQLLQITQATSASAEKLIAGLSVVPKAIGLDERLGWSLVSERLMQELGPKIGAKRVKELLLHGQEHGSSLPEVLSVSVPELFSTIEEAQDFCRPELYLGQSDQLITRAIRFAQKSLGE
ncbi:MAG: lyase family protein [Microbacteriaceae bacterium]